MSVSLMKPSFSCSFSLAACADMPGDMLRSRGAASATVAAVLARNVLIDAAWPRRLAGIGFFAHELMILFVRAMTCCGAVREPNMRAKKPSWPVARWRPLDITPASVVYAATHSSSTCWVRPGPGSFPGRDQRLAMVVVGLGLP